MKKKKIAILGSTGSIGRNCLDVIGRFPEKYEVIGLASNTSIDLLAEQVEKFKPREIALFNEDCAKAISSKINSSVKVYSGVDGLNRIAAGDEV